MNLIYKIYRKIQQHLKKWQKSLYTERLWKEKKSDVTRWKQKSSLFSNWDDRTQMLAAKITEYSTVLEFGAGRLVLKEMLPKGCTYIPSDIVARSEDTLVIDLNQEALPRLPITDYVVFSGVLEYVFDVQKVLAHCASTTQQLLFSYATIESYGHIKDRRYNGWVSDLSETTLIRVCKELGFSVEKFETWKGQSLYQCKKIE
ncbi:MAG: class I SAM-dependent methyltransferase [Flavobacteriales bacterium]|nr:class I SAM-dependent methyltransferase [Flavobacteriales bacterium]